MLRDGWDAAGAGGEVVWLAVMEHTREAGGGTAATHLAPDAREVGGDRSSRAGAATQHAREAGRDAAGRTWYYNGNFDAFSFLVMLVLRRSDGYPALLCGGWSQRARGACCLHRTQLEENKRGR